MSLSHSQPAASPLLHPLTWVVWLGGVLCLIALTRNPFYLLIILLALLVTSTMLEQQSERRAMVIAPGRFALAAIGLTAVFTMVTTRYGTTVVLAIPNSWPLIGGPLTLEGLLMGVINGLALAGLFTAFHVLTTAVPIAALIRWIPRAFFPVAIATAIALSTVPTIVRQARQIREAQAVRGHRMRGVRDAVPLLVPLLIISLERAFQRAEAMTARGFASAPSADAQAGSRVALVGGLAALLFGWLLRLAWGQDLPGTLLMTVGAGVILLTLWISGRRVVRTRYHEDVWHRHDAVALLGIGIAVGVWLLPIESVRAALAYLPYPTVRLPLFDALSGLATLGVLGPGLLASNVLHRDA